ncbi:MAG TPA: hypothetical protein VMV92_37770 [Streptosporangiaceae bacterium]|nr:hypothetical protein [Streptosporangiaceae bacterium]
MRLRLIDRVRRYLRPGLAGSRSRGSARAGRPAAGGAPASPGTGRHRRDYGSAVAAEPAVLPGAAPQGSAGSRPDDAAAVRGEAGRRSGETAGQAGAPRAELPRRVPRTPAAKPQPAVEDAPFGSPVREARARRQPGQARAAIRPGPDSAGTREVAARARARPSAEAAAARMPWYEIAHARRAAEGYADCGPLELVLRREWPTAAVPSAPVVRAVNRLADLPQTIKEILAAGLEAIHVGDGGVPDLDDMARLRGVPLPSGRATWDACAGAYGERKIIVGSRPSAAPDVMCHEVGHALDDIDRVQGRWQSDSAEFRKLYERCQETLVSDFHKQAGDLGRREFFADAFAAIASRQRPALVDMLGGNTRTALDVMLYFNIRYGL